MAYLDEAGVTALWGKVKGIAGNALALSAADGALTVSLAAADGTALSAVQVKAGDNVSIASDGTVSATDTTYTAGENVTISGNVISSTGGSGSPPVPVGTVLPYAGATAPSGWLMCDGSEFSADDWPALASVLGTTTLPDMRGRFALGASDARALGSTGGEESHVLTASEMPAHKHTPSAGSDRSFLTMAGAGDGVDRTTAASGSGRSNLLRSNDNTVYRNAVTSTEGGGAAHNNMPPYLALNWIIRALGEA